MRIDIEEIELCGAVVCVEADVQVDLCGREFGECEGHGRVCTFGGSATVVSADPVSVVDENGKRNLTVEELAKWNAAFWSWLNSDREQWIQELAWGA